MRDKTVTKIISILVVCFFLVACDQEKANNESSDITKEQPEKINNVKIFDTKYYILNENYGIALSTLENNDKPRPEENVRWIRSLTINYPQIYNMEDVDKENRLNNILFKEALNIRDIINDIDYIEYKIDYEIKEANEDVISILFTGHVYDYAHANDIVYAVTIDLNDERFMDLSDFYKVDKSLVDKFVKKEFKLTEDKLGDTDKTNKLVAEYISSYSSEQHLHDFYIKDEIIGLVIPAPQAMNYLIIEGVLDNSNLSPTSNLPQQSTEVMQTAQNDELKWTWCIKPEYTELYFIDKDLIAVEGDNGKYTIVNTSGEIVIPFEYLSVSSFEDGLASVSSSENDFFMNKKGENVFNKVFESAGSFSDGLASVKEDGLWGFIDKSGNMIIKNQYDEVKRFNEGMAVVEKNNKWGFINKFGRIIADIQYDEVKNFSEGLAAVMKNGKWGFYE